MAKYINIKWQHKMYYFNHFQVYNSVALGTFTVLSNHQHFVVPELSYYSKKKPHRLPWWSSG